MFYIFRVSHQNPVFFSNIYDAANSKFPPNYLNIKIASFLSFAPNSINF